MRNEKKLTPKQKRFIDEYLIDLNATQAAIRAGYSEKTAKDIACENLAKPNIQAEIQRRMQKREQKTEITKERVLRELACIGMADYTDFVNIQNGRIIVKDTEDIPKALRPAITSIRYNSQGQVEVRLADKNRALEMLCRHLGMFNDSASNQDALDKLDKILREVHANAFESETE